MDSGSTSRQKANTKDEEPALGILNEGFRYRDLETGIFLTKDPLGFVDGPNVYSYVRCNPWTAFDPEGLWERTETIGVLKAVGGTFEAAAGASFGVASSWTGVGAIAGVGAAAHGIDTMQAGLRQVTTAKSVDSFTSQGLQAAGMSKNAANLADAGVGIVGSLGAGVVNGVSKISAIAATDEAAGMTLGQIVRATEKGSKALSDKAFEALGGTATSAIQKAAMMEKGLAAGSGGLNLTKAVSLAPTGLTPAADAVLEELLKQLEKLWIKIVTQSIDHLNLLHK